MKPINPIDPILAVPEEKNHQTDGKSWPEHSMEEFFLSEAPVEDLDSLELEEKLSIIPNDALIGLDDNFDLGQEDDY